MIFAARSDLRKWKKAPRCKEGNDEQRERRDDVENCTTATIAIRLKGSEKDKRRLNVPFPRWEFWKCWPLTMPFCVAMSEKMRDDGDGGERVKKVEISQFNPTLCPREFSMRGSFLEIVSCSWAANSRRTSMQLNSKTFPIHR